MEFYWIIIPPAGKGGLLRCSLTFPVNFVSSSKLLIFADITKTAMVYFKKFY